jgi:hypothetical protein
MPSAAEASSWRAPQTLGRQAESPPLFEGGASLSVAAWMNRDRSIDVSELTGRFERFGRPRQVRAGSGSDPLLAPHVGLEDLAVSPRGDAVLVWVFTDIPSDPPQYSVRSAVTSQWSAPAALDRHGESWAGLTAGIDSSGTVTFAWVGSGTTKSSTGLPLVNALRTEMRLPDGSLLPVQTISEDAPDYSSTPPSSPPGYSDPQLSVAGSGAAVVAWDRPLPGGRREVLFAQRAPGATSFGPRRALPALVQAGADKGGRSLAPRLQAGVDNAGGSLLAWLSRESDRAVLSAQRVAPDGQLGRLRRLSPPGAADPQLAVNGRGDSVVAWRFYPHHPQRVRVAVAAAGHGFGRPVTFPGTPGQVITPRVTLNPEGDALVAWRDFRSRRQGNQRFADTSWLWSSLRVRGGRFTPPVRLPSATFVSALGGVALAPNHRGAAVWTELADPGVAAMGAVFR